MGVVFFWVGGGVAGGHIMGKCWVLCVCLGAWGEKIALWVGEGSSVFLGAVGRSLLRRSLSLPLVGWAGGVCRCDAWALVRVLGLGGVSVRRGCVRASVALFCGYVGVYSLMS